MSISLSNTWRLGATMGVIIWLGGQFTSIRQTVFFPFTKQQSFFITRVILVLKGISLELMEKNFAVLYKYFVAPTRWVYCAPLFQLPPSSLWVQIPSDFSKWICKPEKILLVALSRLFTRTASTFWKYSSLSEKILTFG